MRFEDSDDVLLLVHVFEAGIEAVFDCWIERDEWQAWMGPEGVRCEVAGLDARPGGRFEMTMLPAGGAPIPVVGTFKTVDRPHCLVFTWGFAADASRQSLLTLSFRALGPARTEMTLRQEGLGGRSNRDAHRAGWESAFQKLASRLSRAIPSNIWRSQ